MIRVSYESISNSSLNPSPRNGSMFLRLFGSGSAEVHFAYLSRDEVVCLSETFPRKMQCLIMSAGSVIRRRDDVMT